LKTIVFVFGTRPEAVKMAPVILALREHSQDFRCRVVVTAQHRDMLDQVLNLFGIKSDHDLNVMEDAQTLTDITVRSLTRLEPVLRAEKPDLVLVHGDTTTTLAAALAAFYQKIPVGHVEAGLRSHDFMNPFPEEANRRLADALCTLHFAPTQLSRRQLLTENIPAERIFVTGNTGIDALRTGVEQIARGRFQPARPLQALAQHRFVLVTAHRRENFGRPIQDFCQAILRLADERRNLHFIYPVHPNPQVLEPVHRMLGQRANVHLLKPLDYGDLLFLMQKSTLVLTDSGGIQEEAPSLGKPVLVLRKVTERPEAVQAGTVRLVGTDTEDVYRWTSRLLDDVTLYTRMANAVNPYGDGQAAGRTVEAIRYHFGLNRHRPEEFQPESGRAAGRAPSNVSATTSLQFQSTV
jgi:UDP-N-acetylglucosamine 2-epimerase (non-hydrolysing)